MWLFVVIGALILLWFFLHIRARERRGQEPLLHLRLFRDRIANLAMGTQTLGSSLGTALAGSILVAAAAGGGRRHGEAGLHHVDR